MKPANKLSAADRAALKLLPDGWFEVHQVSVMVLRPRWRCGRLVRIGNLKSRVKHTPITGNVVPGHFFHTTQYKKI